MKGCKMIDVNISDEIGIKIKKLHPDAVIPTYGSEGAAGFDLYAIEDVILIPGETKLIKTGLAMQIPFGYEVQVRPRSGMSLKTNFRVANAPGTIDSDYRGECCVIGHHVSQSDKLKNSGNFLKIQPIEIKKGDRIAQGVLNKVPQAFFEVVEELDSTDRGVNGFGHTGA
jgi:dUTP pyrophosphatase